MFGDVAEWVESASRGIAGHPIENATRASNCEPTSQAGAINSEVEDLSAMSCAEESIRAGRAATCLVELQTLGQLLWVVLPRSPHQHQLCRDQSQSQKFAVVS